MLEREYLLSLSAFQAIGPRRLKVLFDYFGSYKKVWKAKTEELLLTGLNQKVITHYENFRKSFNLQKYNSNMARFNIETVIYSDSNYPANLKNIIDAPQLIYTRGLVKKEDSLSVAIVGSRIMTNYGKEVAEKFSKELTDYNITVVSGLAFGVDACAQNAAFKNGGRTVGILASGLDYISPAANRELAFAFIKANGALISENPVGYMPQPFDFPLRDRLIAGFAKAVIVVEGRIKSGTFYTVKAALEQGKSVFAVPGPINSPYSEVTNYLIQNGAKPLLNIRDILDDLNIEFKNLQKNSNTKLASQDSKLLQILENGPRHLDEVVRITGVTTAEISARLTIMEMNGLVKNIGESIYKKL